MTRDLLEEYRWLVSDRAAGWLARLGESSETLVQTARRLRKDLTAEQAHLVLEQHQLRQRAAAKFPRAERMFFTRVGLEQATDLRIAQLKAQRFPSGRPIVDLCCGIGGDLIALAQRAAVSAVDLNPIHALLAEANCRVWGLTVPSVRVGDAADQPVDAYGAWHIDPDRRSQGSRTTRLEFCQPPLPAIERMWERVPHGAVKLAPASHVPPQWRQVAERQWIGSGRECRQQVIWFGDLATHPGRRTAIVVDRHGRVSPLLVSNSDNGTLDAAERLGRFVYEPHAAVLAAGLTSALAAQFDLSAIDPAVAYLTGNHPIDDLRLSSFEVLEVLPFDEHHLREAARRLDIGQWEVKSRGVRVDPEAVRRRLRGSGNRLATLLISPVAGTVRALITLRISGSESLPDRSDKGFLGGRPGSTKHEAPKHEASKHEGSPKHE